MRGDKKMFDALADVASRQKSCTIVAVMEALHVFSFKHKACFCVCAVFSADHPQWGDADYCGETCAAKENLYARRLPCQRVIGRSREYIDRVLLSITNWLRGATPEAFADDLCSLLHRKLDLSCKAGCALFVSKSQKRDK